MAGNTTAGVAASSETAALAIGSEPVPEVSIATAAGGEVAEATAVAAAGSSGAPLCVSETPVVLYEWVVKWSSSMRALLLAAENSCKEWVEAENTVRTYLTNVDKRTMLSEEDVSSSYFVNILYLQLQWFSVCL